MTTGERKGTPLAKFRLFIQAPGGPAPAIKRLTTAIIWDARIQARNGFYAATGFVLLCMVLLVSQVPAVNLGWLLPPLLINNLVITAFYFIGGLALLERAEGSLTARVATPLLAGEYLAAKVVTLALIGLVENLVIALLFYGMGLRLLPLLAGLAIGAALLALAGFITVVRYDSINSYLMPSIPILVIVALPVVTAMAGWQPWPVYLHPLQAALVLVEAAFAPVPAWKLIYGLVYGAVAVVGLFMWALRAYQRFVVEAG